ncbi:MAG: hypothetical protein ABI927_02700 [Gaiellaceae bacterium]
MRHRLAAFASLIPLLAAGCSDDRAVEARDLRRLVLQPSDLPAAFLQFDAGKQVMADRTGERRADPQRFGRLGGWKARYRLTGTPVAGGPQIVESRADVFKDGGGAEKDLDAYRSDLTELAGQTRVQTLEAPALGDEAFALTRAQGSGRFRIRLYTIVWRDANVSAALSATGFDGRFAFGEALALARAQARRIAVVIGG